MTVSYRSMLAKVRDDLSEEEWEDLFKTASYIYRSEDDGKDRDDFYNAMMALPVANIGALAVEVQIQSWQGLHNNPMLPLWIEQQEKPILDIIGIELAKLMATLENDIKTKKVRPHGKLSIPVDVLTKKSEAILACVQKIMKNNYGIVLRDFSIHNFGFTYAVTEAIRTELNITSYDVNFEALVKKTKIVRSLSPCFKRPTPKTILSFLFEDEP